MLLFRFSFTLDLIRGKMISTRKTLFMNEFIQKYINEVSELYKTERAREHAYRPALHNLLDSLKQSSDIKILNDPKKSEHGAPDFIVIKKELPIGYIETKDIGKDLNKTETSEQLERYYGYTNLILTDYLEFRFFRNGEKTETLTIGKLVGNKIEIYPDELGNLERALKDFIFLSPDSIRSGLQLAKIMGGKARRIRDNVKHFLIQDSEQIKELIRIYSIIKKLLVHDLSKEAFADMYAQTLVYGLFVARYHDESADSFTRQEARDLIPKSNPLLRHFFDHIAGPDFDKRLEYIVNELCEVFLHANVNTLMKQYFEKDLWGKTHKGPDPVIHFYEDFLKEYDSGLRKKLGAFYTPLPIVSFIVRSVDHILEKEFKLASGLANTSKIENGKHKVQILDPATGTGTFISATIRTIYERLLKSGQKGRWPAYVHNDLLPRIHGFELMMAPYTIAHLKLSMAFKETGFFHFNKRLGIYLTNSLEESPLQQNLLEGFGLAESIAEESKEAAVIKKETPIMVVLGNPPYSGISSNETTYANSLVERYKVEPGGKQKLKERKHWLNDDYVKFIAFAESMIEKNEEGVVGMITNNGYLDNPTFRGMRWHLAKTFNKIYVLNLHGNAKKEEKAPDGSKDENVFNIMQGVSIILAIRKGEKENEQLSEVYYADLYGTRKHKFQQLSNSQKWQKLSLDDKMLFFVPKDTKGQTEYEQGIKLSDLFIVNGKGIVTGRDKLSIDFDKNCLQERINDFSSLSKEEARSKYLLGRDSTTWKVRWAQDDVKENLQAEHAKELFYRPFDQRYCWYLSKSSGFIVRPSVSTMKHYLNPDNIGIMVCKQHKSGDFSHALIHRGLVESCYVSNKTAEIGTTFPLFLFDEDGVKTSNFRSEIVNSIEKIVGKLSPEDILDYIYAVLYSPSYREKYKEFLKIDFPRVPYPKNAKQFEKLAIKGKELRLLHLMESPTADKFITTYPEDGDNKINKVEYKDGKVYINSKQYFGSVPEVAWNFYIGGYQPGQKWLKDREGRVFTNEDIEHYQKIIKVLVETDKIMKEIDNVKLV